MIVRRHGGGADRAAVGSARPAREGRAGAAAPSQLDRARRRVAPAWIVALLAALVAAPAVLPTFYVWVLVEMLAFALFAASLHLLMGAGGMVSFGHAAYFGLGAYGAALAMTLARLADAARVRRRSAAGGGGRARVRVLLRAARRASTSRC